MSVLYELGFSAVWTFFYFCLFCATWAGWNAATADDKTDESFGFGAGNAKSIIGEKNLR